MQPEPHVSILLVDDRPENLLALEAVLASLGHQLVTAGSGTEALKQLLQRDFAVILLDVQMPDMDGFETAELVRGRERSRTTPIIFLTAVNTSDRHVFRGYEVGCVDYLLKPIVPEVLVSKVQVFVELFCKENELRRARDELERRVRERTAGLEAANRELRVQIAERERVERERAQLLAREQAARAEAEAAVRLRDQFLQVASHELKTPLTSLHGNVQLIQRRIERAGDFDERNRRLLDVVFEQAVRLNRLIEGMLDISRIQSGQLTIECAEIDMGRLARRVAAELQLNLERHRIALVCDDGPLVIEGDELRLEQVLYNLLQNAVKYSPAGGAIEVRVVRQGGQVRVAVRDEGIGIPAGALPHLFTRFYRADNADPQIFSGLGIGLYVVSQIVELHRGSIEVASAEGRGSTFTVTLPARAPLVQHDGALAVAG